MQECVSEFISFITSQGAEKCSIERRKTLNGEDILYSMYTLGFENYAEALKIYLAKYREFELGESELRRQKYLIRKERKRRERLAKQQNKKSSKEEPGLDDEPPFEVSNEGETYDLSSDFSNDEDESSNKNLNKQASGH